MTVSTLLRTLLCDWLVVDITVVRSIIHIQSISFSFWNYKLQWNTFLGDAVFCVIMQSHCMNWVRFSCSLRYSNSRVDTTSTIFTKKGPYTSLLLMNNPFSLRRCLGDIGVTFQTGAGKYTEYQRKGRKLDQLLWDLTFQCTGWLTGLQDNLKFYHNIMSKLEAYLFDKMP